MNELCEFIRVDLVRATLLLSAAAILLGGLWRVLRIRAAGMESGAWLVVLGHGFLLAGIALPWPDFLGTQQTDVVVALSTPLAPPTSEPSAISVNGIEPIAENALGSGNDVESRNSSPNAPIVATADSITRSLLESEPEGSPGSTAKLWILKLIAVTWLTGVLSGDEKALEPKSDDAREDLVVRSVMKLGDRRFAHRSSVDQVALAPDGKWIASTCFNRSSPRVEIWDAATGERSGTLVADDTDQRGIESIAVSPDGKWLIGGQQDGWINVWRTADWKLVSRSKSHDAGVSAIAFSPDSKLFASGTERGTVQLCRVGSPAILEHRWQIEKTPAPQGDISISGTSGVAALVFSTDGGRLLTGTAGDARISVIDVASGEIIRTIEHAHPVGNMNPGLSSLHALSETEVLSVGARTLNRKNFPPGLIAYSRNVQITELKVWNTETGELSRDLTAGRFDVGFGHAAVAPDRRTAVLGCRDKLMFFDLTEGVELRTVAIPGWWGKTPSIASDRVAVGTEQRISVWDLRTGRPVLPSPERNLSGIIDCDWFDDGRVVALVDQNGILNNWDVNPGRYRRQESFGPGGHARSLARSADGSMFAAAGEALDATGRDFGLAQVWKADGSRYWQYHLNSRVRDCSMSSDGSHMVVASSNGSIGDTRFHLLKVEGNVLISAGGFPPESEQGLWQCETLAFTADNEVFSCLST